MKYIIALLMFATYAHAQEAAIITVPCGETKAIIESLGKDYHEQTIGGGLTKSGDLVRLFTSDKHTFTIVRSNPNGMSCLIASGLNWEGDQPEIQGKKS